MQILVAPATGISNACIFADSSAGGLDRYRLALYHTRKTASILDHMNE